MIQSRTAFLTAAAALVLTLTGCGGGGGGGGSDTEELSRNACGALGLGAKTGSGKIITGTACETAGSPVVSIRLYTQSNGVNLCTGTMITATALLTAAHCFAVEPIVDASIDLNGTETFATAVSVHPQVRSDAEGTIYNDVAVLTFPQAINLPTLPILASQGVRSGDEISIFGFGLDENDAAGVLKSGEMLTTEVTANHIFAVYTGDGSNTCQGDSGGPAIVDGSIVGVTSTGSVEGCGVGDVSLFANVQEASNLDFIKGEAPGVVVR